MSLHWVPWVAGSPDTFYWNLRLTWDCTSSSLLTYYAPGSVLVIFNLKAILGLARVVVASREA